MDQEISKWILEFLLRQKIDEKIINGVLESVPLIDNDNYRLKKTLLLRKIEYETSDVSISEKLLDWLEIIEEIDHREGKLSSDSMKKAYCDVAVDCTVRFLDENIEDNAKYAEAVKRVWRDKVCKIESLASEESKRRLGNIEAAVSDSDACGKLMMLNTRNIALKSIKVYLAEAWESLGKTFLELVAEKAGSALEEVPAGGGLSPVGPVAERCRKSPANREIWKSKAPLRRKHIAVKSKRYKGAKISHGSEGNEDGNEGNEDKLMGNTTDNPPPEVENNKDPSPELEKVSAPVQPSSMEPNSTKTVNPSAPHTTQASKATENTNSETNLENQGHLATPSVNRVQEALKSSLVELHAVVQDPLPDALRTAETLSSTLASNKSSSKHVVVKGSGVKNAERENPTQDSLGNEGQQHKMKLQKSERNMMEPNGTAHTYEWDDSIDNSGDSSKRPCLPSQNESKPQSPLKGYVYTKFRRIKERKKWTPLEEETLRTGVQKYGKGNWKTIWNYYREIFKERTEVDLKDKWRNMTK